MVGSIAPGNRMQLPVLQQTLDKLRKPREKTEAETKLDEIITSMKRNARDGGAEAARQKLERIKAKLKMLQMAAGSAAASGDAKAARAVARQIKEAAKELSDALHAAGGSSAGSAGIGSATPPQPSQAQLAASKDMNADNPAHQAALNGGTLAEFHAVDAAAEDSKGNAEARAVALLKIQDAEQALQNAPQQAEEKDKAAAAQNLQDLKAEARSLMQQMRKILEQARLALLHPLAQKRDAANAQDEFRAADQALAGLNAASLNTASLGNASGIDLSV